MALIERIGVAGQVHRPGISSSCRGWQTPQVSVVLEQVEVTGELSAVRIIERPNGPTGGLAGGGSAEYTTTTVASQITTTTPRTPPCRRMVSPSLLPAVRNRRGWSPPSGGSFARIPAKADSPTSPFFPAGSITHCPWSQIAQILRRGQWPFNAVPHAPPDHELQCPYRVCTVRFMTSVGTLDHQHVRVVPLAAAARRRTLCGGVTPSLSPTVTASGIMNFSGWNSAAPAAICLRIPLFVLLGRLVAPPAEGILDGRLQTHHAKDVDMNSSRLATPF